MANVKDRLKAHKSADTKGRRKGRKLSTGTKESGKQTRNTNNSLQTDYSAETSSDCIGNSHKHNLPVTKSCLATKSGRITKSKRNIKILDILKSELMINDNIVASKIPVKLHKNVANNVNNNNHGISDKNIGILVNNKSNKSKKCTKNDKRVPKEKRKRTIEKKKQDNTISYNPNKFECDYCHKMFRCRNAIERHVVMHLDIKPWTCSLCSKKFRQDVNLKIHIKRVHKNLKPDTYVCDICQNSFYIKENLILHIKNHAKSATVIQCTVCDKLFSYHMLLSQHEKKHLVDDPYKCSICDTSYSCLSRLAFHLTTHMKVKKFACKYCGKEFLRSTSIKRHIKIYHGGHRLQCPICNKKLKGHLAEHIRTHEKKRPHECPECGQRFTQSTQLNVHRRSHSGVRPYPCRICGRPFSHSNALMLHIRRHTGEKPFPCAMCPISFSQLPHMKAHMQNIHGKENPYRCTKCNQFFKLKVQIVSHSKTCMVNEDGITQSGENGGSSVEPAMGLSRMRFLLALLLTMIASNEKLKYLGFNKRLIDDLLVESLEAMGQAPCKDKTLTALDCLKTNIQILLNRTVPKEQMEKFKKENKTTEDILELLTDEKKEY